MAINRIEGDVVVTGRVIPQGGVQLPDGQQIPAANLMSQVRRVYAQSGTAASAAALLHVVAGASGTLRRFESLSIVKAVGDATVTVDLHKNGSTVLTAPIQLDSGDTNLVPVAGALASVGVAAGDVLTVHLVATAGTGTLPSGVGCQLLLDEDNLP